MYERIETRGGKPKFNIKQKLAIADEYAQGLFHLVFCHCKYCFH